jgi:hypothetical protein
MQIIAVVGTKKSGKTTSTENLETQIPYANGFKNPQKLADIVEKSSQKIERVWFVGFGDYLRGRRESVLK